LQYKNDWVDLIGHDARKCIDIRDVGGDQKCLFAITFRVDI